MIQDAVRQLCDRYKQECLCTQSQTGLLTTRLAGGRNLSEFVQKWLASPSESPVQLLTGELGSGKTMATCLVPERVRSDNCRVIWIPFRDTDLIQADPTKAILDLLAQYGLPSATPLWGTASGAHLLILDGVDEAFLQDAEGAKRWMNTLLLRLRRSRTRVLISGRDLDLERPGWMVELREQLNAYRHALATRRSLPEPLHLEPWDPRQLFRILQGELAKTFSPREVARRMGRIRAETLSSPLLYQLAFTLLSSDPEPQPGRPTSAEEGSIESYWDLLKDSLDSLVGNEAILPGPEDYLEKRRHAAQEIALHLALSGLGTRGETLEQIQSLSAHGFRSLENTNESELRQSLMKVHQGRYAPFHESVLIHLAAEALDRLARTPHRQPRVDAPPDWVEAGEQLGFRGFVEMMRLSRGCVRASATQEGSVLQASVRHWVEHRWPRISLFSGRSRLPLLDRAAVALSDNDVDAAAGAAFEFLLLGEAQRAARVSSGYTRQHVRVPGLRYRGAEDLGDVRRIVGSHAAGTVVEIKGVTTDGSAAVLLPRIGLEDAHKIHRQLARAAPDLGLVAPSYEPLVDYQIGEIIVQSLSGRVELSGVSSHVTFREIVEEVEDRQIDDDVEALVRRADGSELRVLCDRPLEDYQVCSDDSLSFVVRGIGDSPWVPLPSGRFPTWRRTDSGLRFVGSHELGERVSLSRDLVTVAQYAQFLEASPDAPLPQQEEVGWRREGRTIRYVVNLSDRPVVGISRAEAERYIDWLRVEEVRLGSSGALKLQLPEPEWLQIAALGSHLTSPEADGGGVYGHERLTGVVWQWTSRAGPGAHQTQVFGGSASIGSPATPGSAQKSLMLGWPDLCRAADDESGHADVGFRIARIEP